MNRSPKLNTRLMLIIPCLLVMANAYSDKAFAQSQEAGLSEHIADDTCFAMSFNVASMLELAGDFESLTKFKERDDLSSAEFTNIVRHLLVVSERPDGGDATDVPYAWVSKFREGLDKEEFLTAQQESMFFMEAEFEEDEIAGRTVHKMKINSDDGMIFGGSLPIIMFGDEGLVLNGTAQMLENMLAGKAESKGRSLVEEIEADAQFHMIVKDAANLAGETGIAEIFSMMMGEQGADIGAMIEECQRIETKLDLGAMSQIAIIRLELSTDDAASAAEEMLKEFLEGSVPDLLDQAEGSLESIPEEMSDFEDSFRDLVELGRSAAQKAEFNRTGSTLEITLERFDGVDDFPKMVCGFLIASSIQRKSMAEKFGR